MEDDRELEVIRSQMEETRTSLVDKLEALEGKVKGTVEGAAEAVQETVQTVRDTLDPSRLVERHPWAAVGGAVALGFAGGYLLGPSPAAEPAAASSSTASAGRGFTVPVGGNGHGNGYHHAPEPQATEEPGPLEQGVSMLQGLAVGTLFGVLREAIVRAVPTSWVSDVVGLVDDWTTRLGGKPLRHEQEDQSSEPATGETPHDRRDETEVGRPMGTTRW